VRVLIGIVFVSYPVIVWIGLRAQSPRWIAALLLCVMLPLAAWRLRRSNREALRGLAIVPIVTVVVLALSAALDAGGLLLAVPVVINTVFLTVFGATLRGDAMPMIERFARLQEPDLTPGQQAWCRLWTVIWCAFFVANASTALVLALAAPLAWWATYNGLIAYVLIGILFAVEWTLRRRRFSRG
jgi:uncharacterized membrane protein